MTTATRRTRRLFKSYAECEEAYSRAVRHNGLNHAAVNRLVCGEVAWLPRRGHYQVGVLEPTHMHGGIVVVVYDPGTQRSSAAVYYADDWTWDMSARPDFEGPEAYDLKQLARDTIAFIEEANRKETA